MGTLTELVDQGIRAYVEGRTADARRILEEVLRRDPAEARARSYLILLGSAAGLLGGAAGPASPAGPGAGTPAPAAPPPATPRPVSSVQPEEFAPSPWDDGPAASATIVLEPGGGMDLAAVAEKSDLRPLVPEAPPPARSPREDVDVWMAAAKDLHALGDFSGSLELIEKILKVDPEHGEARDYLRQNEATLVAMYESKLGPMVAVPRLAVKPEEVMWLNLDHRAGFLLSQIDGRVRFEDLFDLSGLPRLDTARILATLMAEGVITA